LREATANGSPFDSTIPRVRVKPLACLLIAASLAFLPSCSTPATHESDPLRLVGTWRVLDTGERLAPFVSIGDVGLRLWTSCGSLFGDWRTNQQGMFVAELSGGDQSCFLGPKTQANLNPTWLTGATAYRQAGGDELLLDGSGRTLARLVPARVPRALSKGVFVGYLHPVVTSALRKFLLQSNSPLPNGLLSAVRKQLLGRWVPADRAQDHRNQPPYLSFSADGTWSGSDGCNGLGGRWNACGSGALIVASGGSTLIGCNNVEVGEWLSKATQAGFQGRTLVLVDAAGHVTGRLRRA